MAKPSTEPRWLSLQDDPLVGVKDIAGLLAVPKTRVRHWLHKGLLRGVKAGRDWRVRRSQVLKLAGIEEPEP